MDPIHPILPQSVNLPPILPASKLGRITRDQRDPQPREREGEPGHDEPEDDDVQGESHIDISA